MNSGNHSQESMPASSSADSAQSNLLTFRLSIYFQGEHLVTLVDRTQPRDFAEKWSILMTGARLPDNATDYSTRLDFIRLTKDEAIDLLTNMLNIKNQAMLSRYFLKKTIFERSPQLTIRVRNPYFDISNIVSEIQDEAPIHNLEGVFHHYGKQFLPAYEKPKKSNEASLTDLDISTLSQEKLEEILFPSEYKVTSEGLTRLINQATHQRLMLNLAEALIAENPDEDKIESLIALCKRYGAKDLILLSAIIISMILCRPELNEKKRTTCLNTMKEKLRAHRDSIIFPDNSRSIIRALLGVEQIRQETSITLIEATFLLSRQDDVICRLKSNLIPILMDSGIDIFGIARQQEAYFSILYWCLECNNKELIEKAKTLTHQEKIEILVILSSMEIKNTVELIKKGVIDRSFFMDYRDPDTGNNALLSVINRLEINSSFFAAFHPAFIQELIALCPEMISALNEKGQNALELLWSKQGTFGKFPHESTAAVLLPHSDLLYPNAEGSAVGACILGECDLWATKLCQDLLNRGVYIGARDQDVVTINWATLKPTRPYVLAFGAENEFLKRLQKVLTPNERKITILSTPTELSAFLKTSPNYKKEITQTLIQALEKLESSRAALEEKRPNQTSETRLERIQKIKEILQENLSQLVHHRASQLAQSTVFQRDSETSKREEQDNNSTQHRCSVM